MLKKIKTLSVVLVIILGLFLNPKFGFAETPDSCQLKEGVNENIEKYLKDLRKISKKIVSEAKKKALSDNTSNISKSKAKSSSTALRLYNSATSWGNYYTEFDYKIYEPLFNNVPNEIKRDTNILRNEIKKLNKLMEQLTKKGYLSIELKDKNICNGIENCNLNGKAGNMLILLISSTKNLKEIIESAASNNKNNINLCNEIQFIEENTCQNIYKIYHDSKQECQDDKPKKTIKNIGENFKFSEKSTEEWEKAWKLLVGGEENKDEYNKIQKKLLKKELGRQGIGGNQAEQIMKNLDEYNRIGGYSMLNNPIGNITKTIANSIDPDEKSELKSFADSIAQFFEEEGREKVSIKELRKLTQKKQTKNTSNEKIERLYKEQLILAKMQDLDTNQIVRQIINMNNSISVSINTLNETIPISEKVCNSQGQGDGKCRY